jgi:hypothetical protein
MEDVMHFERSFLLTLVVGLVATSAFGSSAGATSAPSTTNCGTISGPKWTHAPESGTKYLVTATGSFQCAVARKWVSTLANDSVKNKSFTLIDNNVLTNGPKGYACGAHSSKEGKAFAGQCGKGPKLNPTSGFTWMGVP